MAGKIYRAQPLTGRNVRASIAAASFALATPSPDSRAPAKARLRACLLASGGARSLGLAASTLPRGSFRLSAF